MQLQPLNLSAVPQAPGLTSINPPPTGTHFPSARAKIRLALHLDATATARPSILASRYVYYKVHYTRYASLRTTNDKAQNPALMNLWGLGPRRGEAQFLEGDWLLKNGRADRRQAASASAAASPAAAPRTLVRRQLSRQHPGPRGLAPGREETTKLPTQNIKGPGSLWPISCQ
ncbi:hypothetical protein CMUS01_02260 [Colletotrichum musicola]|uniref:Uncharacterized protein n=1 Tax=Colletotrichum musicola TaxID=2175873 RepID=A0A8H6NVA7_9PEZI|nr:hypothetical protein CMUS01_02260 [Colletotrichum musicola]